MESACSEISEQLSRHVRFKYAWRDAHYTDGSVKDDEQRGRLVGAAVYRTSDGRQFLINPCGKGVTNTINRAELSAIYHVFADISDPTDDVLIFTDSQVSIQLINRILRRPDTETGMHKELLLRIATLILQRAQSGHHTSILKVKSHIGIVGNEAADRAAKAAADNPQQTVLQTPASNPFLGKWWPVRTPVPQDAGKATEPGSQDRKVVSNLGKGLKSTVGKSTKLGKSNQASYYVQSTQAMYTDPFGAHPQASNAYLGSRKCTHSGKCQTLKARMGVLFTQARAKMMGMSHTDACPLCGEPDSIGHLLGGCSHNTMGPLYISRHDQAVIQLYRALQKGTDGGSFTIIDAGKMHDVINILAADGKRLPTWLLPGVDPDTLRKMRPDILRIPGLPAHATPGEIRNATLHKGRHKIQIIEVGYCSDFRWKEKLAEKQEQHRGLVQALQAEGWDVEEHHIILGSKGTVYKDTLNTLQKLGLSTAQAYTLMVDLNIHAANYLAIIVKQRRQLEPGRFTTTDRRGVG